MLYAKVAVLGVTVATATDVSIRPVQAAIQTGQHVSSELRQSPNYLDPNSDDYQGADQYDNLNLDSNAEFGVDIWQVIPMEAINHCQWEPLSTDDTFNNPCSFSYSRAVDQSDFAETAYPPPAMAYEASCNAHCQEKDDYVTWEWGYCVTHETNEAQCMCGKDCPPQGILFDDSGAFAASIDEVAGMLGCSQNTECEDNGENIYCDVDDEENSNFHGKCVECTEDGHCAALGDVAMCAPGTRTCIAEPCAVGDCEEGIQCSPHTGVCSECVTNQHCSDLNAIHADGSNNLICMDHGSNAGTCVQCMSHTDCGSFQGTPSCNVNTGTCEANDS